ncbi:dihydrofolate reductase family protein [Actinophytocola glycyrrhizae]|uniref:Dihydrofolate reductase family protein n=1 Tax=Actinophytocola glycyrrhizae TaxID=2044873 RepID=A0ABV9S8Q5_9PSEU
MSKVLVYAAMSLDGYVAGTDVSRADPLGVGGEQLHEWMFGAAVDPADRAVTEGLHADTGAVVVGRRTFDVGLEHWEDVPYPVPTFVVTHRPRPDLPQRSGTFSFVAGVEAAVERARAAAGERTVTLMGADVQRQAMAAGLVDEVMISLVPVLLGAGAKLFDHLPALSFAGPVVHPRFAVR